MNKPTLIEMLKMDLIKWSLMLDSNLEDELKKQNYKLIYNKKLDIYEMIKYIKLLGQREIFYKIIHDINIITQGYNDYEKFN